MNVLKKNEPSANGLKKSAPSVNVLKKNAPSAKFLKKNAPSVNVLKKNAPSANGSKRNALKRQNVRIMPVPRLKRAEKCFAVKRNCAVPKRKSGKKPYVPLVCRRRKKKCG